MSFVVGNAIPMAQKSLDFLWKKQEITMSNIANVDTPGYKAQYATFEEAFRSKLRTASQSAKSSEVGAAIRSADTQVHRSNAESARLDGNNVNTDVESVELARSTLQYQYLTDAVNSDIIRYRTVIKG